MSELHKDLYSASCNPPRRAKRPSLVEPSLPTQSSLDMPSVENSIIADDVPAPLAAAPVKRGRKPGPLSRSAREAQRRLNHSIIEKARRTKINDTLATLRQLVPVDYGTSPQSQHEDEEDDDDDDYPEGAKRPSKPKTTGRREEKEKEFKLEILVRTVSYLQDLLKRVDTMENTLSVCQHCGASQSCKKRKHNDEVDDQPSKQPKVTRIAEEQHSRQVLKPHRGSISNPYSNPIPTSHSSPIPNMGSPSGARLPSISSWLPNAAIEPTLSLPQNKSKASPNLFSYPSPPSSTHFDPIRTSQIPPILNLGPVATAAMVALPSHTSEDESAASLLLQIAKSPPFRPSIPSPTSSSSSSSISNYSLADPSIFSLHSDVRNQRMSGHVSSRQPETPRSLLGLHRERKY
jgi:Helix-loop-helix DNA-binding domain